VHIGLGHAGYPGFPPFLALFEGGGPLPDRHALLVTSARVDPVGHASDEADTSFGELGFVEDLAAELRKWLEHASLGFAVDHCAEPDAEALGALERALRGDTEMVHFLGHGYVRDGALHLVPATGSFDRRTNLAAFGAELNTRAVGRETLLVLDLCHAGAGLETRMIGDLRDVWVVCAAGDQRAFNGWFTQALTATLTALAEGRIDIGTASPHLSMDRFRRELGDRYWRLVNAPDNRRTNPPEPLFLGRFANQARARSEALPFFPNPRFDLRAVEREAARDSITSDLHPFLDVPHFIDRVGPHFTGRDAAMRELGRWRSGHDASTGLKIVCGAAGSGKSAIVGAFVLTGHPAIRANDAFRDAARQLRSRLNTECRAAAPGLFAAVHARRRRFDEVLDSLIDQLDGQGSPALDSTSVHSVADLSSWLERQSIPPLLVVDALDEAADPESLVRLVLLPLLAARHGTRATARILVAARADTERNRALLALLEESAAGSSRIDLDEQDPNETLADLEAYLTEALEGQDGCCTDDAAALARTIGLDLVEHGDPRVYGKFLVASLYAKLLNRRTRHSRDSDMHLPADLLTAARIPHTLPEVLELDFTQITDPRERRRRRSVLAALAYSKGEGMPAAVTGLLATEVFGADAALNTTELLHDPAGIKVYLRSLTDPDGVPVYRLFHQSLDDYLRAHPIRQEDPT
jgi:hypothetical protein